jgi:preprotein translocase subunit SecD
MRPHYFVLLLGYMVIPRWKLTGRADNMQKHDQTLPTGWYYTLDSNSECRRTLRTNHSFYFIDPKPITTAHNVSSLNIEQTRDGRYILTMRLDDKGAAAWEQATKAYIGKYLAFILDNDLLEVDFVNCEIPGGITALISGKYDKTSLEKFKTIIESEK